MVCEKCWADAFRMSYVTGKCQIDCYNEILQERKDSQCTPEQQAGVYWDDKKQCDSRI